MDAELEWKQFYRDVCDGKQLQDDPTRYTRINLDLYEDPPRLDDKAKLSELQVSSTKILKTNEYRDQIERIAHRLIASTFYFLKEGISYNEVSGIWTCTGL